MSGFPTRYDAKGTRPEGVGTVDASGPTRTKQEFRAETDINRIMARYLRFGVLPAGVGIGRYGDFSQVGDYMSALDTVRRAEDQFRSLPATVRAKFNEDPMTFLAFVGKRENLAECKKLGLLRDEVVIPEPEVKDDVAKK